MDNQLSTSRTPLKWCNFGNEKYIVIADEYKLSTDSLAYYTLYILVYPLCYIVEELRGQIVKKAPNLALR
jgi:hypothetical protein